MKLGDYLRAFTWRGLLISIGCLVVPVACSTDTQLGDLAHGCSVNSDCASPLVCAFQRCHNACESSRDCPIGLHCVASDRPFYVCQLEQEQPCVYNSSCPLGQVCGVDGQCRDQCQGDSDCLADQKCVSGSCAEKAELHDGGLTVVTKKDAGPTSGQTCSYNSQCPDRMICTSGICQAECMASSDCTGGRQCVQNRCQVRVCPETDAGTGTACAFSSDCPAPLVCRSGACTCECRLGGDCPTGYDCFGNRCALSDTIGPEGGMVVSSDGRLTLQVPQGALTSRVLLTMDIADAWPTGALGPVFDVRPSGTSFATPVTFVYRYEAADVAPAPATSLRLAVAEGTSWTRLPSAVNTTERTVTSQTTHLSKYGLIAQAGVEPDASVPDASVDAPVDPCASATCSGTVSDGCCPKDCTAAGDADCGGCGNGRLDPGETCDPPGSCPVCDDQNPCTTDTQTGSPDTCNVRCVNSAKSCSNAGNDLCCPIGCTAQNDSDCAGCGDGVVNAAAGETCDPPSSCPTSCPAGQCWEITTLTGSAATCNVRCSTTTKPCSGTTVDGCCPPGCNASPTNRDVDCPATCGNSIVDNGETCDPLGSCPVSCPMLGCTTRALVNGGTCAAACVNTGTQTVCANGDGCCPAGCNSLNDNSCVPSCGNGVVESGELCDGNCPASCPAINCQLRSLAGTACTRQCVNAGTITACTNGDACCPGTCNANNDNNCTPFCSNGVIESGETCDGNCPLPSACVADKDNIRTYSGSAANCTALCAVTARLCSTVSSDGFCPTACTPMTDIDCAVPNDTCGGAIDITNGGTFAVDMPGQLAQDSAEQCSVKGPDAYYKFKIVGPNSEYVYFSVLDKPYSGKTVQAAIELYTGDCPPPAGMGGLRACDTTSGGYACNYPFGDAGGPSVTFPLLSTWYSGAFDGVPLQPGDYVVVVRRLGAVGSWALNYNHVPQNCASNAYLSNQIQSLPTLSGNNTCKDFHDQNTPSCAPTPVAYDDAVAMVKCPNQTLTFSTCDAGTRGGSATTLSARQGSLNTACLPMGGTNEFACATNPVPAGGCVNSPGAAQLNNVGGTLDGIVILRVDARDTATGNVCAPYGLVGGYQ